jgi:hypothetical protein
MANELKVQNGLVVKGTTQITGSLSTTAGITGSLLGTASFATLASNATTLNGVAAANYAVTNNTNTFSSAQTFQSDVTIQGTASIAYLNVTFESASIIYSTGSNQLGDAVGDTQRLTGTSIFSGSMQSTGSLSFANGFGVTGSLFGTASWASNALTSNTASYVLQAVSSSYATFAANSSQLNGQAASYYLNASNINAGTLNNSYLPSAINVTSVTASFKGDLVGTSSWASNASAAATATTATNATNVAVTDNPAGASPYYIAMVSSNSGNQAITVDSSTFTYLPSTDTLTVTNLAGTASLATTASYALNAKQLNGQNPSYYLNASNISAGTLGNAYLPSAISVSSVTASFTGSLTGALTGTASYATQALSASFATTAATASTVTGTIASASMATSASFASTASYVNTLSQDVTINSGYSLSIGANSRTFSGKQLNKSTATTIISVNTGTYTHKSIFVRYVLTTASGTTDMRAGTIMLVSDANGNVSIAEATTQDIGDTSMVNFTATASGGINEIVMTPSSGNWDVFFDYTLI